MTFRPVRGSGALRRLLPCIAALTGGLSAAHAFAADAPAPSLRGRLAADISPYLQAVAVRSEHPAAAARTSAWRTSLDKVVTVLARQRVRMDADLECMAKAVHREAAGQPLSGQLAVAQVIQNRMRSGRFPTTICSVVNQPGQFFSTRDYKAPAGPRWTTALAVARLARMVDLPQVAPGALFFHAAAGASAWSGSRLKVAVIGGQVFYR